MKFILSAGVMSSRRAGVVALILVETRVLCVRRMLEISRLRSPLNQLYGVRSPRR